MDAVRSMTELATAVDRLLDAPVLLTGTPPPDGRDLDLLARVGQARRVSAFLAQEGFLRRRNTWAAFDGQRALAVELLPAENWASASRHDGAELLAGAVPLAGFHNLVTPAPHVQLVLAAQHLLVRRGRLSPGARRRATEAAAAGPGVWDDAAALAHRLDLTAPVAMLRRSLDDPEAWSTARRAAELVRAAAVSGSARPALVRTVAPHRRRPLLVSLSGPDGSGKSTQAALLRQALEEAGVPSAQAWTRTTMRPTLPAPLRAFADRWRRPAPAVAAGLFDGAATTAGNALVRPVVGAAPTPARGQVPPHVRLAEHLWITSAVVSNAALVWRNVWRGRKAQVLVLDRFVLDADVKLTYWYAHRRGADISAERRLFRAICPSADVAVFLGVAPETNSARRADEWELHEFRDFRRIYAETLPHFGAVVVDAERPVAEVARDVAETVWRRLP